MLNNRNNKQKCVKQHKSAEHLKKRQFEVAEMAAQESRNNKMREGDVGTKRRKRKREKLRNEGKVWQQKPKKKAEATRAQTLNA